MSLGLAGLVVACTVPDVTARDTNKERDSGKKKDTGEEEEEEEEEEIEVDSGPQADPPLPDGGTPPGAVYAHTPDTLYLFEPIGKKLTKVGAFDCLEAGDSMLDIALDRDGIMYGTSYEGFISIKPSDGTCSYIKKGTNYPNSLSVVPLGTVDNTKEVLVGYTFDPETFNEATIYTRIDPDGTISNIGTLNDPAAAIKYKSSGDLIALIRNNNKAYLTVKTVSADAGTGNDYLAEIDPKTGRIKTILGDIKKKDLWGFGYWAGTGFGFSGTGDVIEVDMSNGASKSIMTLTDPDGGAPIPWYGAGVKTFAPTAPTQ